MTRAFLHFQHDPTFVREYDDYQAHFTGRPSPLYPCVNLSRNLGGAQIYLKREDLNHLAHATRLAPTLSSDVIIVVNLSGRGDKDVDQIRMMLRNGHVVMNNDVK